MIVKSRIATASAAETIEAATGTFRFCEMPASVIPSQMISAISSNPIKTPQPCQPDCVPHTSPIGVSTQAFCHDRKRSMNISTPAASSTFVAVLRSAMLGIAFPFGFGWPGALTVLLGPVGV